MIETGLERLKNGEYPELIDKNIGLIINHTSVDSKLQLSLDLLVEKGYNITAIFAPEHGIRGDVAAGEKFEDQYDEHTGVPIYSLYGEQRRPTKKMLGKVDVLLFDIQDLGVRFYTYIYTLAYCMEEAGKFSIPVYVLDRPNPIDGITLDGNIVEDEYSSFVANYKLLLRHGMTVCELANYFNEEFKMNVDLKIVKMNGWKREMKYEDTGLPFVMPSPNATGKDMMEVYPGTCFIEGTNISEGRGTTAPFRWIGAPWMNAEIVKQNFEALNLPGVHLRPVTFTPLASKFEKEACQGIEVHVLDRTHFKAFETGILLVKTIYDLYPQHLNWIHTEGELFFDLLSGTDQIRKRIENGEELTKWLSSYKSEEIKAFKQKRASYLLY
ncbi:exo-beta-N-acetylmuramidase NamZ family protein [Halalkalibacillus halophilus]|uniref:exo-beta-N-acetylmuramidase NamZ family protein n=1 Tax=Halalkalibacillus halophilus TaxID=392827 RepID=UPI0003FEEB5E|nr:DUF1343 domain-containing protein [Halalkalibacillus halophilus]